MSWDEDFREMFSEMFKRWRRFPFLSFRAFEDIDKIMEEMFKDFPTEIPKNLIRERKLPDGSIIKEMGPFVYGYSMILGSDGKPVIREFGNVKPSTKSTFFGMPKPSLEIKNEREPLVDIMDENDNIKIVAELPGVNKSDINLNCTENAVTISVDTPKRKYYKEIELPAEVDSKNAKASYINGVLELTLPKIMKMKPKGERIKIE
jgi:HSP20 family protein